MARQANSRPRRPGIFTRPWVWALLYICLVPLFAGGYLWLFEGDFAQTNFGFNDPKAAQETTDAIGLDLAQSLAPVATSYPLNPVPLGYPANHRLDGVVPDSGRLVPVFLLGSGSGFDNVTMLVRPLTPCDREGANFISLQPVHWNTPVFALPGAPSSSTADAASIPWDDDAATTATRFLSVFPPEVLESRQAPHIGVPLETCEKLSDGVRRLFTGDPTYGSGAFWRMLYFSAVTITTLGYGDITPVRDGARVVAGLEAVSGVVIAGLFLNALWRSRTRSDL